MDNSMKITAGLGSIDEYERLCRQEQMNFLWLCTIFLGGKIWHSNAVKSQGGSLL